MSRSQKLSTLGFQHLQAGRFEEAVDCYKQLLACMPDQPDVLGNLAVALKRSGRWTEAVDCFHRLLALDPYSVTTHFNLGSLFQSQGRWGEAAEHYQRVIEARPDDAEAWLQLGRAQVALGRVDEAVQCWQRALVLRPSETDVLLLLAQGMMALQKPDEVVRYLEAASETAPGSEACQLLGEAWQRLGNDERAIAAYRQALAKKPERESFLQLGLLLRRQGRLDGLLALWQEATREMPDWADGWNELGNAHVLKGEKVKAVPCYQRAWELDPNNAAACLNMGNHFHDEWQAHLAAAFFQRAIDLKPDQVDYHYNLAIQYQEMGLLDRAMVSIRRSLALAPQSVPAYVHLLFASNYLPDISEGDLFDLYQGFDRRFAAPIAEQSRPFANPRVPGRRLKIGYVSPDFRNHPCANFIRPLLQAHDRERFEIFAYAELAQEDDVSREFVAMCDGWRVTAGMSDAVLADRIQDDQIDILVDVGGHTANSRLLVFAHRPAPIQVTWPLGLGYTSGLASMDYYLTDNYFVPEEAERYFSESIYRMSGAPYVFSPPAVCPEVGLLPAIRNGHLTLGCFSRPVRLNHRVLSLWSRLFKAIPTARLRLNSRVFGDPGTRQDMAGRLIAHGFDPDRFEFRITSGQHATLQAYGEIDVALDPFPHNAGTTTIEALWMGVPTVTLQSRPPLGRFGTSYLSHLGLTDWIADSPERYVQIVAKFARDLNGLSALRSSLRGKMERSSLCDQIGFAREVERAYTWMWDRWSEGNSGS